MIILADIHTHTLLSGHAFSSLLENARCARENGLAIMASTDHGPRMPGANPAFFHFANLQVVPEVVDGVRVLKGIEANVLDDEGSLDVPDWILAGLDLVLAGLHDVCISQAGREENTTRLIRLMERGYVDVITHPGNPYFPIDGERVVEAAARHGVLLELNNSSLRGGVRPGSRENCLELARWMNQAGIPAVLGSDAHWCGDVGRLDKALELALAAGFSPENILNLNPGRLEEFVAQRKARRAETFESR